MQNVLRPCVPALTYSDLVDELEAVLPHQLLPLLLQVDSRFGLRLRGRLGRIFSLQERCGGRVFTWKVTHLAHRGRLGICIGAELTGPLDKTDKEEETQ